MAKVSRTDRTIANELRDRVLARFPELAADPIPGVWFTGSNIWTALLGEDAPEGADWDVVLASDSKTELGPVIVRDQLVERCKLGAPVGATKDKPGSLRATTSGDDAYTSRDTRGLYYETLDGQVDVWFSPDGSVLGALRQYKTASHAHCRAAFSLIDGLVSLPNELAPVESVGAWGVDQWASIDPDRYAAPYPPLVDPNDEIDQMNGVVPSATRYEVDRSPALGVVAFAVLVFLVGLAVFGSAGCGLTPQPASIAAPGGGPRSAAEQAASAVDVERMCVVVDPARQTMDVQFIRASGSVVAPGVVLTANHVVRCGDGAVAGARVFDASGREWPAVVSWRHPAHDLALLAVPGIPTARPALVQLPPPVGGQLCHEPTRPERGRRCGHLTAVRADPPAWANGAIDLEMSDQVTPGNSGSAVYDASGYLVGVATNTSTCGDAKVPCLPSYASSVAGRLP